MKTIDERALPVDGFPGLILTESGKAYRQKGDNFFPVRISRTNGYSTITYYHKEGTKCFYLPSKMAETFGKEKPGPGYFINHLDGDRDNCSIENLRWIRRLPHQTGRKAVPVIVTNTKTGTWSYYRTISLASKATGISFRFIKLCLEGKYQLRKKSHLKFKKL